MIYESGKKKKKSSSSQEGSIRMYGSAPVSESS